MGRNEADLGPASFKYPPPKKDCLRGFEREIPPNEIGIVIIVKGTGVKIAVHISVRQIWLE